MTQMLGEARVDLQNFSPIIRETNGVAPWLAELRGASAGRFHAVGFPKTDEESWRFTNVAPIARSNFASAQPDHSAAAKQLVDHFTFGERAVIELVFVNGHFCPQWSKRAALPRGARVLSLAEGLKSENDLLQGHLAQRADIEKNQFVALNTSYLDDGVVIHLPKNATVEEPIHLLFVSAPSAAGTAAHPRVLIVADDNVEAQIVESYVGPSESNYFVNAVTEVVVAADCRIDHCKLQMESPEAFHVATMAVELGRASQFASHNITLGGKLTRNDISCIMNGERSYGILNGLALLNGTQHCDNHTLLDHAQPNCPSHELYKYVLRDRATGVFKGQILVRQIAQKTDSKQSSKSLLLSDEAQMNSMPALEIYADDVKCTHGSTTGPLDEDMAFYLRSRGLSNEVARHLLTYAFAADVTRRIKVAPVRERVEDHMASLHGLPKDLRINDLGGVDEAVL